jgi:DNA-binding MarR family transcriptional regulator
MDAHARRRGAAPRGNAAILNGEDPRARALDGRRSSRPLDIANFIPASLTNLAAKITSSASSAYRPRFGVGITEWRVMVLLANEPWSTPVHICAATGLDKGAVSRSLRDLALAGLVEILDDGPKIRRLPVALTEKGLDVHDGIAEAARAREAALLADFSDEERALLQSFLMRLQRRVESFDDPGQDKDKKSPPR